VKFDVVIIGSGLGGLQCGYILSREGYNVCILEKNSQLGGCLQTFTRRGTTFDTGMHYIGSMEEGQMLHEYFRYFGLTEKLKLRKLDEEAYDVIRYMDREYNFAMGFERFTDTMLNYFPGEREALEKYTGKLREIGESVSMLSSGESGTNQTAYFDYFSTGIDNYLDSITGNRIMKNVLLGLSPIYAGRKDKSPLYIPMVIHLSFINSAFRFVDGGSQVSDLLAGSIEAAGGTIMRNAEVTQLNFSSGSIESVTVNNTEFIEAKHFISNIHPARLLEMAPEAPFRPAYRNRVTGIEDTCGVFTLYLSMKPGAFPYRNRNYYVFKTEDVWGATDYTSSNWPLGYMLHFSPSSKSEEFATAIIVNTYLRWKDVEPWKDTMTGKRGKEYLEFKKEKAEKLLAMLESDFPGISNATAAYYTSTPLTYRDFIGSPTGSIYGLQKDFNNPLSTMVVPRTSIPNLLLTGQNINIHGVIGVTICSVLTCSALVGQKYLIGKMKNC
jgi:all-trans-retinol 13,14-reductase